MIVIERILIQRVVEEWEEHEVVVEVLVQLLVDLAEVEAWCRLSLHVLLLLELSDQVGGQVLDLHSVRAQEKVAADASSPVRSLEHGLLSLVVVHTQLDQVHLLEDLEVHVHYFLREQGSFHEADQLTFAHNRLQVLEDLTTLEGISFLEVKRELERVFWVSRHELIQVLIVPLIQNRIFINLVRGVYLLDFFSELNELLPEHLIQELVEGTELLAN